MLRSDGSGLRMSLEKERAKVIVILEWGFFVLAFGLLVILIVLFFQHIRELELSQKSDLKAEMLIDKMIMIIILVGMIISLALNILLTQGVHQERIILCKVWYIINSIFVAIYVIDLVFAFFSFNKIFLVKVSVLGYRLYAVRTIMAYVHSLRAAQEFGGIVQVSVTGLDTDFIISEYSPVYFKTDRPPSYMEAILPPPPPYTETNSHTNAC